MPLKHCWEIKKCGREKGGKNELKLGICPAYPNNGHSCWMLAGTLCEGKIKGTFAQKEINCLKCEVYKLYNMCFGSKKRQLIEKYPHEFISYLSHPPDDFMEKSTEEKLDLINEAIEQTLAERIQKRTRELEEQKENLAVALNREKKIKLLCAELNNFTHLDSVLNVVILHIKSLVNCEAVAIRLHDSGDYPYYVSTGFPKHFIKQENSLCAKDNNAIRIPNPSGEGYLLECMCGNIIRGRFNPSLPFFTKKGSFWSNNTSTLLNSTTEEQRQSKTRNTCNSSGYESVALIPIKSKGKIIGLIQLNDKNKNRFTENLIEFLEMIGEQIGIAIQNSLTYEKQKQTEEKLKHSNAALEEFAYIVSHDLQSPLRTIEGFSQLLAKKYNEKLDSEAKDFIDYIVNGVTHMQELIKSLLEYSRINTQGEEFKPVDCNKILKQSITNLEFTIKKRGAVITYDFLPTIKGDSIQLCQLFQNLISNAIKFCDNSHPKIKIKAEQNNGKWLFSVIDNGIGIEPEYTKQIFTVFKRLHSEVDYPGTGIGLSICKKIAERHGGRIWVESEKEKGSVFYFTIPT